MTADILSPSSMLCTCGTGVSVPKMFPNVMRAFRTWNSGISGNLKRYQYNLWLLFVCLHETSFMDTRGRFLLGYTCVKRDNGL